MKHTTLLKVTLLRRCFPHCLNCTNGTKSHIFSHLFHLAILSCTHPQFFAAATPSVVKSIYLAINSIFQVSHFSAKYFTYPSILLLGEFHNIFINIFFFTYFQSFTYVIDIAVFASSIMMENFALAPSTVHHLQCIKNTLCILVSSA